MPPSLLQTWSSTLQTLQIAFEKLADPKGEIDVAQFKKLEATFPGLKSMDLTKLFMENDLNKTGKLSFSDVTAIFHYFLLKIVVP